MMRNTRYTRIGTRADELMDVEAYQVDSPDDEYYPVSSPESELLHGRIPRKRRRFRPATTSEMKSELSRPSSIFISVCFVLCTILTWEPVKNKLLVYRTLTQEPQYRITPLGYVPAIVFPVSANRGLRLLDAIESFDYPVEHLIIHDNSEGEGSVACALERIQKNHGEGHYPNIRHFSIILSQGTNTGASFSWNSLASYAFDTLQLPWIFISNDDLALLPGALKSAGESMWKRYRDHSLILSNSGLPGIGHAFSFFGISNVAFRHLGLFDENYWPAYHEDCDYLARALAVGLPWYKDPGINFIHPIPGSPPDEAMQECMDKKEREHSHRPEMPRLGPRDSIEVVEGPEEYAYTNRHYFLEKWGNTCDADIYFRHPFNDPRNPVSFWGFDEVRRHKIKSLFKPGVLP